MKALEYNLKAQRVAEQIQDPLISAERLIAALNNIGVIYAKKEQTRKKALEIFEKALDQATRLQDAELESKFCSNIGETYYDLGDYEKALQYFDKAIEKYNGVESLPYVQLNKGKVFTKRKQYAMAEEIQREALANLEKVDSKRDMAAAFNALANTLYLKGDLDGSILAYEKAVELGRSLGVLEEPFEAYGGLAKVYSAKGEYRMAYEYHLMESQVSDSLYDIAYRQQLESFHFDDQIKDKDHKLSLETKERELAQERAQSQKKAKIAFQIGMGLVLVILFILFRNFRNKVRINKLLDSQKAKIETLLLNILPASVAKELEKNGQAAPRFYDSVSVLFTDFKDFTRIADTMTPREIVDELNDFFTAFDDITERHGLEKIKTIGDAYMCAGGIPVENETHPVDIIRAAIDIVDYMAMKNVIRKEQGKNPWNLRVGIHTGPIAAGVVGKRKYAYDIWGSSVNIASRMESNGEPGKINISSATYELVKDKFKCTYRGKISAKNIGEIDMYFVEHEIREPELVS
jgi:class 3 adenylate cyclase/tetratricopeptide (TPR) repeat protein